MSVSEYVVKRNFYYTASQRFWLMKSLFGGGGGEFRCARISKYGGKLANALPPEGNDKARENCQSNHSRALETDKKHRANE